jgi:hypothetical protein
LLLREEQRLKVFENKDMRRTFGLKRDKIIKETGESCIMRRFAENN